MMHFSNNGQNTTARPCASTQCMSKLAQDLEDQGIPSDILEPLDRSIPLFRITTGNTPFTPGVFMTEDQGPKKDDPIKSKDLIYTSPNICYGAEKKLDSEDLHLYAQILPEDTNLKDIDQDSRVAVSMTLQEAKKLKWEEILYDERYDFLYGKKSHRVYQLFVSQLIHSSHN